MLMEKSSSNVVRRPKLGALFSSTSNRTYSSIDDDVDLLSEDTSPYSASPTTSSATPSQEFSPYHNVISPWNNITTPLSLSAASPFTKSPWLVASSPFLPFGSQNGLIGSIVREEGHIYSLATSGELLYTGSDSKNVRVWKNLKSFSGFKCSSGLIKTIVISGEKIFTGHQDGKIRIWKISRKDETVHKRIGSLPNFKEFVKKSFNPKNYVEVRRKKNVLRIKHYDAVSCMSLNDEQGLLYSGSWDKTLKVWRISDSKCLESVTAHEDAINAVVTGFHCLVFTGSADGTVKVWKRENTEWNDTSHTLVQVLLKQEYAVTALAVNSVSAVVYAGSSDGLVNFWERGKQLIHGGVLRGHKLAVLCLATSGRLVLSGGADKNICVWKREEGGIHTCLSVFTGHTGPVKCLAVEEDREQAGGKVDRRWIVYSGSLDKSVKVWRVSEQLLRPDFIQIPQGPK